MSGCRVRKDHWKGMSAMERSAIAQQQVQQVAEKKARQQQLLHEDWQYARSQADIARNMASQASQVSVPLTTEMLCCAWRDSFCDVHSTALYMLRQIADRIASQVCTVILWLSLCSVHARSQLEQQVIFAVYKALEKDKSKQGRVQ